jgi:hypothetical protein
MVLRTGVEVTGGARSRLDLTVLSVALPSLAGALRRPAGMVQEPSRVRRAGSAGPAGVPYLQWRGTPC